MPSEFDMTPEDLRKLREEEDAFLEKGKQEDQERFDKDHQRVTGHDAGLANQIEQENQEQAAELSESPDAFGETGKQSMQGPEYLPLPNDIKDEIYRIQSLPADQRAQETGALFNSLEGSLGNTSDQQELMQTNAEIMRSGKGVIFHDSDGNEYQIDYE
jgi:hypothetical protein